MGKIETAGSILARGLEKTFGYNRALKNVDLDIMPGEFWVFFGPNGAGKTTLTAVLATLLKPTGGQLYIGGSQVTENDASIRLRIGLVSHQTFLYNDLTAYENLLFYGKLYELDNLSETVSHILEKVGLGRWADQRVRIFSRGMQQRLAIARALLHDPQILLLDEPYAGLDQHAIRQFRGLLDTLHTENHTIVLTTHDIRLGASLCTHVAFIVRGRIIYRVPREELDGTDLEELYFRLVKEVM